ncbi:MAG: replicative DNA helicase [Desulfamplus sp.]|nr:replicative DNA helicase [Desulfamplus sp.]MBF0388610.1 replicative DNA helicase [Desulfamplus sp.]
MANVKKKRVSDPLLDRVPPHDIYAEESLLSAILIDNDTIMDVLDVIKPEDFYKKAHEKIFKAITELFAKAEPVDLVTVATKLREKGEIEDIGGAAFLASIADAAPVAVNAIHYAKIIKGKSTLRALIHSSMEMIERCMKDRGDFEDIIDFAQNSVFKIAELRATAYFTGLSELLNLNLKQIEHRKDNKGFALGLTTGYKNLDAITSGLQKSDLIIIAARPSMGKTAFALNIARNVAYNDGASVAIFSLEMSKEQLSMRILTSEARIDSKRLKGGYIDNKDLAHVSAACVSIDKLSIYIDDTPNITVMEIRAKTRRLMMDKGLGLVIIDYLQLMKAPFRSERRDLEIAEISRALKGLAKELNIPVIALSQLNRLLEQRAEKRPLLSDLRESGALEQDADIVAFIYRDEVYNKEESNPNKGIAEIIVAKNRNGAVGTAKMAFFGSFTKFEEIAGESYQSYE